MERYIECGSCGHYHRESFHGDCREDTERFTVDQIPEGAEIVDLEGIEGQDRESYTDNQDRESYQ